MTQSAVMPTRLALAALLLLSTTGLAQQPGRDAILARKAQTTAEWIAQGDIWYGLRSYGRAADAYANARRLGEIDVSTALRFAVANNELGRFAEALTMADALIALNPNLASAHNERAYAQKGLGDQQSPGSPAEKARYDAAIASYRQAIRNDPSLGAAHRGLADTLYQQKADAEAIASYVRAIRFLPADREARYNLGVLLAEARRNAEAAEQFLAGLELERDDYEARGSLATMYLRLDRIPEALEELKVALSVKPDYADNHLRLGVIHAAQGNRAAAIDEYRLALSLDKQAAARSVEWFAKFGVTVPPPAGTAPTPPDNACPLVITTGPSAVRSGEVATFNASVRGADPKARLTFSWHVSSGTMVSGQGTSSLLVEGAPAGAVTAYVRVLGLPKGCADASAMRTLVVGRNLPY